MVDITKKELLEANKFIRKLLSDADKRIMSKDSTQKQRQEVKRRQLKIVKAIKGGPKIKF